MTPSPLALIGAIGLAWTFSSPVQGQNSFAEDIYSPAAPQPQREVAPKTPAAPQAATPLPQARPANPRFAEVASIESEDFGIAPTAQLRSGPMHAPTPTRIEGAALISTEALHALYQEQPRAVLVFDVLGGPQTLPDALNALPASRGGSFDDAVQRDFSDFLQKVTQGKKDLPLVFYCQSVYCWMSYNAALRAHKLGYTKVLWYRGGIEAWQHAGLSTSPRQTMGR